MKPFFATLYVRLYGDMAQVNAASVLNCVDYELIYELGLQLSLWAPRDASLGHNLERTSVPRTAGTTANLQYDPPSAAVAYAFAYTMLACILI